MNTAGKPGRPRAGAERLSRDAILAAALRIVDDEGVEAMTMRRLAGTLGVNPMSIYHHLPNKAAVFAGLAEVVFAGLDDVGQGGAGQGGAGQRDVGQGSAGQRDGGQPRAGLSWQEELKDSARAYRAALQAHPNLALQVLSDPSAVSDVVVVTVEPFYRALDRGGLAPRGIFEAVNTIVDFVHGFMLGELSVRAATFDLAPDLVDRVDKLPEGKAPTLTRVVRALGRDGLHYDFDSGFESALAVLVSGIESTLR
ncbi:TetR/AcrR family transcriptional regulator C-terminal domain-containing protein [Kribbella sp. NPDC051770]|uniref:TetR/AcrR family transcriptional regulator C-terminal domain-containing protein n=1 Tax=Kribbella sp. NPDC051770 TaxID=3155413 RepID=UPI0034122469